jgi:hypothetical protein
MPNIVNETLRKFQKARKCQNQPKPFLFEHFDDSMKKKKNVTLEKLDAN